MGDSIPLACADWANTKAAYRFLSNERVNEHDILSGHFQSTRERAEAVDGPLLVLHCGCQTGGGPPADWQGFGVRQSRLSTNAYRAMSPGGSLLNYLYALAAVEMRIALSAVGLDLGIGNFHVDRENCAAARRPIRQRSPP